MAGIVEQVEVAVERAESDLQRTVAVHISQRGRGMDTAESFIRRELVDIQTPREIAVAPIKGCDTTRAVTRVAFAPNVTIADHDVLHIATVQLANCWVAIQTVCAGTRFDWHKGAPQYLASAAHQRQRAIIGSDGNLQSGHIGANVGNNGRLSINRTARQRDWETGLVRSLARHTWLRPNDRSRYQHKQDGQDSGSV